MNLYEKYSEMRTAPAAAAAAAQIFPNVLAFMVFLPPFRCMDNYSPFLPRGQRIQALLPLVRFGPVRVRSRLLHFVLPLPFPARFFITFAFLIGKGTRETALIVRFGVTLCH